MKLNTKADLQELNRANRNAYSVSADWLSIHVRHKVGFSENKTVKYLFERTGQTKVFKDVYSIKDHYGNHICAYATTTNSCILPEHHGILKFDNKQLYIHLNLKEFVLDFLKELDFVFIGITRLDICYDFHKFFNQRDPHSFISSFLNGKFLKIANTQFRVAGVHEQRNTFNWIYFGSHKHDISCKLYNKTGEQNSVGKKPWIWERWNKECLLNTDLPIWRLEFTVNSTQAKFCNELIQAKYPYCNIHKFDSLDILDHLSHLFAGLFNHYFRFVKSDISVTRKDRMKEVKLLEFPDWFAPVIIERPKNKENTQSARTQKIFINQMLKHQNELREFDTDFEIHSSNLISLVVQKYGLHEWAEKKLIPLMQYEAAETKLKIEDIDMVSLMQKVVAKYDLIEWAKKKKIPFYKANYIYPYPIPGFKNYTGDINNFKNFK